jgi:ABC-type dipeptide/oligopeptide/nickel transport system permease subunit
MALAAVTPEDLEVTLVREQTSLWMDAWRRFRRNKLALAAIIYLVLLSVVAITASFWTPYSWSRLSLGIPYDGPSSQHLLGVDHLGRDLLSRLMKGAQVSLLVGLSSQALVLTVGVVVGLVAGYMRGAVDGVISLLINIFYGIPDLLVALILVTVLGPGLDKVIIAISATRWMDMARMVRGQALSLREREFVEAARAAGARPHRILFGHILPNALGPIIVQTTFGIPQAILFEAFLSFLGLGVQPPIPSWGSMANDGIKAIRLTSHIVIAPSVALCVTLLSFNFLGDGLRDAFDPKQKR